MVVENAVAPPPAPSAPLTAQRRGRRERALAALYDDQSSPVGTSIADGPRLAPPVGAARPAPAHRGGLLRRLLGAVLGGHGRTGSRAPHRPSTMSSISAIGATAAAVAQARRSTGPGVGYYFGTPFPPAPPAPDAVEPGARVSVTE